jgi:chorismate mutase
MTIADLREKIDDLDDRLLSLLNERAQIAHQIGLIKQKQGLDITDSNRESAVLNRMVASNPGPLNDLQVHTLFSLIMSSCREIQEYRPIA